jgi:hypothetical protein
MVRAVARRAAKSTTKSTTTELRIQDDGERLRVLGREHEGLLEKVAKRRAARERMEGEIRAATNAIGAATEELAVEARRLDAEMHAMIERWIAAPRRTKKERDALRRLYEYLIETGMLSPPAFRVDAPPPGKAGRKKQAEAAEAEERVVESAAKPAGPDRGVLRTLYRKLVEAMHPDRVQDEREKHARTEAMKEVTVAYQAGDFARLVELERSWTAREEIAARGEDTAVRIEELVKAIAELKRQLKGLEKEARAVRTTYEWKLTAELKRQGKKGDPIAKVRAQAEAELVPLRSTHAHLARFEAGEITLEALLAGPRAPGRDAEDDGGLPVTVADMDSIIELMVRQRGRGKGKGPRSRRELDMMELLEAVNSFMEANIAEAMGVDPRRPHVQVEIEEVAEALELLCAELEGRLAPRGKGRQKPTAEEAHTRELFHIVETLTVLAATVRDIESMQRRAASGRRR